MEFWRTILVLLRRKSVALPVLLFPLGVAAATYLVMPTQYMSTATLVLTTSVNGGILTQNSPSPPQQINPLLSLDGMKTAASILIQRLSTRDVANQLGAVKGGATTFTVSDGSAIPQLLGSSGPFMVIEGYSTSATGARDIVVRVERLLRDELINEQRTLNAPPSTFIGMIDVVSPSAPEAQKSTKLAATAAALVLGLIASAGVAYFAHRTRGTVINGSPSPNTVVARHMKAPRTLAASRSSLDTESPDT